MLYEHWVFKRFFIYVRLLLDELMGFYDISLVRVGL